MQIFANGKQRFHSFTGLYVMHLKTRGKSLNIVPLKARANQLQTMGNVPRQNGKFS